MKDAVIASSFMGTKGWEKKTSSKTAVGEEMRGGVGNRLAFQPPPCFSKTIQCTTIAEPINIHFRVAVLCTSDAQRPSIFFHPFEVTYPTLVMAFFIVNSSINVASKSQDVVSKTSSLSPIPYP